MHHCSTQLVLVFTVHLHVYPQPDSPFILATIVRVLLYYQNGGCLDQPYKRCMRYDGVHSTFMRWGTPRIRPFKGFAVRMLEHINHSYPHRRHQINNSALDATPAQNALPCLFSHLPTLFNAQWHGQAWPPAWDDPSAVIRWHGRNIALRHAHCQVERRAVAWSS